MEGTGMAGKRSTPEQIVAKLRQVEVLTAQGKPVAEAVRAIGVSEPTYYRWRAAYRGAELAPGRGLAQRGAEEVRAGTAGGDSRPAKIIPKGARAGKF